MASGFKAQDVSKTIEHTLLQAFVTEDDIMKLCQEAIKYNFIAVCVNPIYVSLAYERLKGAPINVCTVIGFPLGTTFTEVKIKEALQAIENGASEVDMVMSISKFKSRKYDYVEQEIRRIKDALGGKILKVIIETCYLTDEEKVKAAKIAEKAGADYIKTSTGFGPAGAKIDDVKLIRSVLDPHVKIKASGGIRTLDQVIALIEAGADRIGTSSGVKIVEELLQR
ncbi:MAG: deoxyribose-phosphate aldolase [Nitrososphaerota archaeon]|nr:deoxyribose-phosphate aldolase [Nitrososphaerota archaeon]